VHLVSHLSELGPGYRRPRVEDDVPTRFDGHLTGRFLEATPDAISRDSVADCTRCREPESGNGTVGAHCSHDQEFTTQRLASAVHAGEVLPLT